jgi:hypothetical protein
MQRRTLPLFVLSVCLLAACGESATPTADQYFLDAKKNLAALDYEAALKNLDRLAKSAEGQPLAQQATVLRIALLASMAEATSKMAAAYGDGAGQPDAASRQSQFIKMKSDYYGIARVRLMKSMEAVMAQRSNLGEQGLPLDMAFPDFTGMDPAAISKVQKGQWVDDTARYRAELEVVRNALARTLARLVGAADDTNKGRSAFEKGGVQIDPRVYLLELSNMFYRLSEMFDRRGLDDASARRISLEVVRDNADVVLILLEKKPDKDLETRAKKLKADCEAALKKL